jgi:hypothetical protein
MFVYVAKVFGSLFFNRCDDLFALTLGEELFWRTFSFVNETADAFFEVPLFDVDHVTACETGQVKDVSATAPAIGEEYRLGAQYFILGGCGFDESPQFRNLYVGEPFYV